MKVSETEQNLLLVNMKKIRKEKIEHKHEYQLQNTQWQSPTGFSGTSMAIEYAYLMCLKCWRVIKTEINSKGGR